MIYAYVVGLTVVNLLFWAGILFNLPGTWLMVLLAALLEWWWTPGTLFGSTVLWGAAGLAVVGEVLELVLGAAGARQSGGSKRGAALAIVGGIVGAIVGTPMLPVLGTLIGACAGAFAGSVLGDIWAGRPMPASLGSGRGAAVGRFWGTIAKLAVGAAIVVLLAAAPLV